MKWSDFLNFSATSNLSSSTGTALTALTLTQLSSAFVDSIDAKYMNDLGGLTFEEFKLVLVRCAKMFPYESADSVRMRLEKMFLHMCNQFQTSVPRILNDGNERVGKGGQTAGGRATSTSSGLLLKGVREFNKVLHDHAVHLEFRDGEAEGSIFKFGGGEKDEDLRRGSALLNFSAGMRKGL